MSVTDRQTDGQTDTGQRLVRRLCIASRGNDVEFRYSVNTELPADEPVKKGKNDNGITW